MAKAKRYQWILFDCLNTLYLQDPSRLPRVEVDGRVVLSTAGLLLERLCQVDPGLGVDAVHAAARAASRWAAAQRGSELHEVPAPRRFRRLLEELALGSADGALADELLAVHMRAVIGSFRFPPEHRDVLETLRGHFRLGLLSNFDHGPSLRRLLAETGIDGWFDPLLVSDGLGYRKPGPAAFAAALGRMGAPAGAVLFVGDSLEDDVQGSLGAGLDVAWFNPEGRPCPSGCRPTLELAALAELPTLLGC